MIESISQNQKVALGSVIALATLEKAPPIQKGDEQEKAAGPNPNRATGRLVDTHA